MDKYEQAQRLQELLEQAETAQEMKDHPDFIGRYGVTRDGQIWSHREQHPIAQWDKGTGYMMVVIYDKEQKKNVNRPVHRMVAETYIPLPDWWTPGMKLDVGHKNDIRSDNRVENLFWCTRAENLNTDHYREAQKKKIFSKVRCVETGEVFPSIKAAGEAIGKHKYGINLCLLGKQQTCGGYHWERVFDDAES